MKIFVVILIILVSYSCSDKKEVCFKGEDDMSYEFLESIKRNKNQRFLERIEDIRQFGTLVWHKPNLLWLRKPNNILIFYGSLKSIGLNKFISNEDFQKPLFTDHWAETEWANKSLMQIVNSLIQEYEFPDSQETYFTKFWKRRKVENNHKEVYIVLKGIRDYYQGKKNEHNFEINETLKNLLWFEARKVNQDYLDIHEFRKEYASMLIEHKLFASAYNLVREGEDYNQDSDTWYKETINKIATDSTECADYWNWRESAIWNADIYDYNH